MHHSFSNMKSGDFFSGNYGFLIVPDPKTIEEAYEIARTSVPERAEYSLRNGLLPHVTLYHADLHSVPVPNVRQLLTKFNDGLKGRILELNRVATFRDFYLFWYTSDEATKVLREFHQESLNISHYRVRPNTVEDISKGRIQLNSQELLNVHHYGHPWVGELFCPHITLAFGCDAESIQDRSNRWLMTVDRVVFARINPPAKIEEIISLEGLG